MKKAKPSRPTSSEKASRGQLDYQLLHRIADRAYYLALSMIDRANSRPEIENEKSEPKVGGHPSACASSKHILGAIHLVLRQPEDYFANKPHVSPIDHAYNFLLHNFRKADGTPFTEEERVTAMGNLRHYSKTGEPVFQSYHAEADPDGYRYFPSGSVGIPPVNALYQALAYNYTKAHGWKLDEDPTFWCLMGDSEFREGSLMEAMPDAGERELSNLVWIVDYNRQNLDGTRVINEKALGHGDAERIRQIAEANGWDAKILKHGSLRERFFALPGGDEFKRVLDEEFSDFEFQSLLGANKPELTRATLAAKSPKLKAFLKNLNDTQLQEAFFNLAGHDMKSLVEAFQEAKATPGKPKMFVIYTIKGHGLQCQALSGNHSAMPEKAEVEAMAKRLGVSFEKPFVGFAEGSPEEEYLAARRGPLVEGIARVEEQAKARLTELREEAKKIDWPGDFAIGALKFAPIAHTQWMWGQIAAKLDRLARGGEGSKITGAVEEAWAKVAPYFLTMAPDVGSSTNTSPNMNGKLFGDIGQEDFEKKYETKDAKAPDIVPHLDRRSGHWRFEIAEGNCMSAAGSVGKMGKYTGIPFYPAMTIYDFFIKRAHDQFYYNLYWHSSFATIGTPSGVTLAAEGAQHSWKSDFQIPNCVTWEPTFAKELEWILADTLRRHFTGENGDREGALIRCVTKGVVQKELLERAKKQKRFEGASDEDIYRVLREDTLEGGYALVDYRGHDGYVPGDNVVHLFSMGALVPEALKASDQLLEKGIFANVYVVTSTDLLLGNFAYKNNFQHLREKLGVDGTLFLNPSRPDRIETAGDFLYAEGSRIPIVSVHDGEPGLLDNIGSAVGAPQKALAIRKTSKSGTTWDIFRLHGIDAEGIVGTAMEMLEATASEQIRFSRKVLSELEQLTLPKDKTSARLDA